MKNHLRPGSFISRSALALTSSTLALLILSGCGGGSSGPSNPAPTGGTNSGGTASGGTTIGSITQANIQRNLDKINEYRASKGVEPLVLDAKLNEFARQASIELMKNHVPHKHFSDAAKAGTLFGSAGFRGGAAENQGDPNGWSRMAVNAAIDDILRVMFAEGPGGGHHDNMMNPNYKRLGVGLVLDDKGELYFTNDFSQ